MKRKRYETAEVRPRTVIDEKTGLDKGVEPIVTLESALLAALAPGVRHVELCKPDGRKVRLLASVERGRVWLHRLERPYRGANFYALACRRVAGDSLDGIRYDVPGTPAFDRLSALFASEPVAVQVS